MRRTHLHFRRHMWKHLFLVLLIALILFNLFVVLPENGFGTSGFGSFLIGVGLLLNHLAFNYTKTGWQSLVMKTVAWCWVGGTLVYILAIRLT